MMTASKKIISVILSAIMMFPFGVMPRVQVGSLPVPLSNREDKRLSKSEKIGLGVGIGGGVPIFAALGLTLAYVLSPNPLVDVCRQVDPLVDVCRQVDPLVDVCRQVDPLLQRDGNLPRISGPALIVGDLHGDIDATRFYCDCFQDLYQRNPDTKLVVTGDFIDRGGHSIEVIELLFQLKINYPQNVYLLRGNHEGDDGLSNDDRLETNLAGELAKRGMTDLANHIFKTVFKHLPLAAVVNNKVFCVHAGISAKSKENLGEVVSLEEIENISVDATGESTVAHFDDGAHPNIDGDFPFNSTPKKFILNNLIWADYVGHCVGYPGDFSFDDKYNSDRSYSRLFGDQAVTAFLAKNNLTTIVRGHAHPQDGIAHKILGTEYRVITLLSSKAPFGGGQGGTALYVERVGDQLTYKTITYTGQPYDSTRDYLQILP